MSRARSNWLRLALAVTLALLVGVACANRQTEAAESGQASSQERLDDLEHDLYSLEHDPIFAEE